MHHTLIEDNLIEQIGFENLDRMYECAGIKFHLSENSLIRRNVIRHIHNAAGLWLDVDNVNNRITNNVFADIETVVGAVYSEMNFQRNLFDHNIIWDVPPAGRETDTSGIVGSGMRCDCNETAVVLNNLFGNAAGETIMFSLNRPTGRFAARRLCRANSALNNVLVHCPHRVHLGRREENVSDGNLYDLARDERTFRIR